VDISLSGGEIVKVGTSIELLVIDTPGHTMSHICLLSSGTKPVLFSGDTLFNAGVGNCHGGGHPEALFETFEQCFSGLEDQTLVYPGHDYIINNLRFTLDREPRNSRAAQLLNEVMDQDPSKPLVTTMGLEKQVNCFLRLDNPEIIKNIYPSVEGFPQSPKAKDVFLALRELRNHW
jgi:hydroxyacylglutathione hydrolase